MKFGIYVGSRAGATCAGPADPRRIGPLVDELAGGRPPTGQVSSLSALIDASAAAAVIQFELFALSDADSASDSPLGTFGLCTGDYTPKPAYETYRTRIKLEDQ